MNEKNMLEWLKLLKEFQNFNLPAYILSCVKWGLFASVFATILAIISHNYFEVDLIDWASLFITLFLPLGFVIAWLSMKGKNSIDHSLELADLKEQLQIIDEHLMSLDKESKDPLTIQLIDELNLKKHELIRRQLSIFSEKKNTKRKGKKGMEEKIEELEERLNALEKKENAADAEETLDLQTPTKEKVILKDKADDNA